MAKAWDRLPAETQKQWNGFQFWLDMPMPRTINGAYRTCYGHGQDTSRTARCWFREWAQRNKWQDRSDAYDQWKREQTDLEIIKAKAKAHADMVKRHIQLYQRTQFVGASVMEKIDPDSLSPDEARLLMRFALDYVDKAISGERVALGQPAEITETRGTSSVELSATVAVKRDAASLDQLIAERLAAIARPRDEESDQREIGTSGDTK